jgi:hypothetical protein
MIRQYNMRLHGSCGQAKAQKVFVPTWTEGRAQKEVGQWAVTTAPDQ